MKKVWLLAVVLDIVLLGLIFFGIVFRSADLAISGITASVVLGGFTIIFLGGIGNICLPLVLFGKFNLMDLPLKIWGNMVIVVSILTVLADFSFFMAYTTQNYFPSLWNIFVVLTFNFFVWRFWIRGILSLRKKNYVKIIKPG